jgi:hypothetical protein
MEPRLLAQGALGVGCVVLAVVFLQGPANLAAFTAVSGFGFSLLGNLWVGPNQVTKAEAVRMVEQAKADSYPPSRM